MPRSVRAASVGGEAGRPDGDGADEPHVGGAALGRDALDREGVQVVAVGVERGVFMAMLDVAEQLRHPVGVGSVRAHAIHSPDANHLRVAYHAITQFCNGASRCCGYGHETLPRTDSPPGLCPSVRRITHSSVKNVVAVVLVGRRSLVDEPEFLHDPPRCTVVRERVRDNVVEAERSECDLERDLAELGREALAPAVGGRSSSRPRSRAARRTRCAESAARDRRRRSRSRRTSTS